MTFQKIVLTIATIFLLLFFIVLSIILLKHKNELQFPPELGSCPDYFEATTRNDKKICKNVKGLGNGNAGCDSIDFSGYSIEDKKKWAKSCNVSWDGLSLY